MTPEETAARIERTKDRLHELLQRAERQLHHLPEHFSSRHIDAATPGEDKGAYANGYWSHVFMNEDDQPPGSSTVEDHTELTTDDAMTYVTLLSWKENGVIDLEVTIRADDRPKKGRR
jgi:hypothetical protein